MFNRRDGGDLAGKLKLLIDSPEKRKEMGRKARERVMENFDVERQTEKLVTLYKKLTV